MAGGNDVGSQCQVEASSIKARLTWPCTSGQLRPVTRPGCHTYDPSPEHPGPRPHGVVTVVPLPRAKLVHPLGLGRGPPGPAGSPLPREQAASIQHGHLGRTGSVSVLPAPVCSIGKEEGVWVPPWRQRQGQRRGRRQWSALSGSMDRKEGSRRTGALQG